MSRKHDVSLAKIVQAKADFLVSLQSNIGQCIYDRLDGFRRWEAKIDAMPKRGRQQRYLQEVERAKMQVEYDSFLIRLGSQVIQTFSFVSGCRHRIRSATRKLLSLKGVAK